MFVNFVNDEDILFTDHAHYRHLYVGDGGDGSDPLTLYALNMEHAMSEANMEIEGAHQGHTLTHSRTHSLADSVTHSLAHSLTRLLAHSLTYQITQSHTHSQAN